LRTSVSILIAVSLSLMVSWARPPAKGGRQKQKAADAQTSVAAISPPPSLPSGIDPAVTQLPSGWADDEYQQLYANLIIAPKDQFETMGQFQERSRGVFGGRFFAFRLEPSRVAEKYDAEKQSFTFLLRTFGGPILDLPSHSDSVLVVKREPSKAADFIGNKGLAALEASLRKGTREEDVFLVRPAFDDLIRINLGMPNGAAKAFRPAFVLVFQPEAHETKGFSVAEEGGCDPTTPAKGGLSSRIIFAGEAELWIVDERTNEVLQKNIIGRGRSWIYPEATIANDDHPVNMNSNAIRETTLWARDSVDRVADFYIKALAKRGFNPTIKNVASDYIVISGRDTRIVIDGSSGKTVIGLQRGSSEVAKGVIFGEDGRPRRPPM
jgi:hypothetical protein